jgi:hypothetical protein
MARSDEDTLQKPKGNYQKSEYTDFYSNKMYFDVDNTKERLESEKSLYFNTVKISPLDSQVLAD